MEDTLQDYGFRYRYGGCNYALVVRAASKAEAEARVRAMASAEFLTDLYPREKPAREAVVCQV